MEIQLMALSTWLLSGGVAWLAHFMAWRLRMRAHPTMDLPPVTWQVVVVGSVGGGALYLITHPSTITPALIAASGTWAFWTSCVLNSLVISWSYFQDIR